MNKLFTKIGVAMVGIAMAVGVGVAVGRDVKPANAVYTGESPYTWTLATGNAAAAETNNGYTLNGVTWKASHTGGSIGSMDNNNRGQQIGSGNNPTTAFTVYAPISSFGTNKKIIGITVNAAKASDGTATLSIYVGGTEINKDVSLTTSSANYSNSSALSILTNSGGNVTVSFSNSAKAFYLKSISVSFENDTSKTYSTQSVEISGTIKNANGYTVSSSADNSGFAVKMVKVNDNDETDTYDIDVESGITYHWEYSSSGEEVEFPITTVGSYNVKVWASIQGETINSKDNATESKRYVTGTIVVRNPITYDFSSISGFDKWDTGYTEHSVTYTNAVVTFASANRSTQTITNVPVTKGDDVLLVLRQSKYSIIYASFVCEQWSTKTQTITLYSSNDDLTDTITYETTGVTSTNFSIAADSLKAHAGAVKIGFSSSSNQIGISSASIVLNDDLEEFENKYLLKQSLPYPSSSPTGEEGNDCLSTEKGGKGYFDLAKAAFNALRKDQRMLFATDSAYAKGYARLCAWAAANNQSIDGNTYVVGSRNSGNALSANAGFGETEIIVITTVLLTVSSAGFFLLKKKKEL